MILVSFRLLAAPACQGLRHSLPGGSRALAGYPCDGSVATSLLYIARSAHLVLWDFCQLKHEDVWLSYGLALLSLRLGGFLVLPPRVYDKAFAPAVVFLLRSSFPVFHLWRGPSHQPSPLALRSIFKTATAVDLFFFVTWNFNLRLELAFCCFFSVSLWVLGGWYRHLAPPGAGWLPLQLAARVLVPLCMMAAERAERRRRRRALEGAALGGAGGSAGSVAGGGPLSGKLVEGGPHGQGTASGGASFNGTTAAYGDPYAEDRPARLEPTPLPQPPKPSPPHDPSDAPAGLGRSHPPAAASTPQEQVESGGADAGPEQPLEERPQMPPYMSFIQRRTLYVKIPWAEPEQLSSDFRERLRELMEGPAGSGGPGGWRLVGTYVRRGCVELILMVEAAGGGTLPGPPTDTAAVLKALGLTPPTAAVAADDLTVNPQPASGVAMWALEDGEDDHHNTGLPSPAVVGAWPRVLLLPPWPRPAPQPTDQWHQQQAAYGGCPSLPSPSTAPLVLRVEVAWGPGGHDGEGGAEAGPAERDGGSVGPLAPDVRVLVRAGGGQFMPAAVSASPPDGGECSRGACKTTHGDDEGGMHLPALSYLYDITLLQLPPSPGVMLVELFRCPRCPRVMVPYVVTDLPLVAGELAAAAEGWPPGRRRELDGLLYDMGVGLGAGEPRPAPLVRQLRLHLRQFAEGAGLGSTAAVLAAAGQEEEGERGGGEDLGAPPAWASSGARDRAEGRIWEHSCGPGVNAGVATSSGTAACGGGSCCGVVAPRSLSAGACPSSSRRGPLTDCEQWALSLAHAIQLVETALLLTLLLRGHLAGAPLMSGGNGVVLTGLGVSAAVTIAWLMLPYDRWSRLAVRARLPRYLGIVASKALVGSAVAPVPPGVVSYATGLGMVLHEGLILPGSCLLDLRTAVLVSAVKLLVNAGLLLTCGGAASPGAALLVAARTEALALATATACHLYLRRRRRQRGDGGRSVTGGAAVAAAGERDGGYPGEVAAVQGKKTV